MNAALVLVELHEQKVQVFHPIFVQNPVLAYHRRQTARPRFASHIQRIAIENAGGARSRQKGLLVAQRLGHFFQVVFNNLLLFLCAIRFLNLQGRGQQRLRGSPDDHVLGLTLVVRVILLDQGVRWRE